MIAKQIRWLAGNLGSGACHYYRIAKGMEGILIQRVTAEQIAKFYSLLNQIISEIKDRSSLGVQFGQITSPLLIGNPLVWDCSEDQCGADRKCGLRVILSLQAGKAVYESFLEHFLNVIQTI